MSIASKIKATAVGAGLTLATVFGSVETAEAQTTARVNRTAPKAATTVLANDFEKTKTANPANATAPVNSALEPAIREGHAGTAQGHSIKHKMLVLQISGPSAEQLKIDAQKLHTAFKNSDIPTDIVVFLREDKELSQSLGNISMHGKRFRLPSGAGVFDVATLEKHASTITTYYHKNYGSSAQTASNIQTITEQGLAANNP